MKSIAAIIFALIFSLSANAASVKKAPAHQDLSMLEQTASQFLKTQAIGLPGEVSIEVGSIEPRLKLPSCVSPTAFLPRNSKAWGKTTVGIRCDAPSTWTIYVSANIRVYGKYVAAAIPLPRGHILQKNDLKMKKGELTALPPKILTKPEQALGRTVARSMHPGAPISQTALRIRRAVKQGQNVRLISTGLGFSITSEGKALNNAAIGQIVRVRIRNRQVISGIADASGTVKIIY